MILHPAQKVTALQADFSGRAEQCKITPIADAGVKEVSSITAVADVAGSLNSKYFTFTAGAINYYAWLNVNSAGVDPAVPAKTAVPVAVATGASAAVVGAALRAAIASAIGADGVVTGSAELCVITNALMGNITNVADGAAATGFAFATTAGVASSLQNKYVVLSSVAGALFHAWLNVNGEGSDPAPSLSTAIEVAVDAGASAASIASAMAAAIEAAAGFEAEARDGVVYVNPATIGAATDATAGNSGFTVAVTDQGLTKRDDSSASPSSISNNPSTFEADS
jgi:hypothetical protein